MSLKLEPQGFFSNENLYLVGLCQLMQYLEILLKYLRLSFFQAIADKMPEGHFSK